ncbi:unnamed protein product [Peronospora destructor]|uniref:Uncharacterized protein n=1 Tax=Peronospora destructor TaxID=86335 RepID=A0AAV0UG17_9STRA|nr:unnamed protein product [Peronospora destructor]
MAPTRELALQIEQEAIKLCKYTSVGLSEKLNPHSDTVSCWVLYPGFYRVRKHGIFLLKSENEEEMEQQLTLAIGAQVGEELQHCLRVTTMFSATMPVEIGDEDSGKNKRIDQRVMSMNPFKKRSKSVTPVAKFVSNESFRCTILHGGKTQDQRRGEPQDASVKAIVMFWWQRTIIRTVSVVLVAGKDGVAISFLTDDDDEIMYISSSTSCRQRMSVPASSLTIRPQKAAPGARDEKGNVIARSKRDTVIYAK